MIKSHPFCLSTILAVVILGSNDSKAEEMVRMVYCGSIGAAVKTPVGWTYTSVEEAIQESKHVFALYHPNEVSKHKAQAYITFIPIEVRNPASLDKEIESDKEISKYNALEFKKTDRYLTHSGEVAAINTYIGKNYDQYVGILPKDNGIFMIVGTSHSKLNNTKVYDGVKNILLSSTVIRAIYSPGN